VSVSPSVERYACNRLRAKYIDSAYTMCKRGYAGLDAAVIQHISI
jgi:hypothetical protein